MKRILIIADVYPPEVSSAASLMQELAEGLKKRGHEVYVATSYPRHYLTKEGKTKTFEFITDEASIKVLRIKTLPLHKVNFFIRGIAQLLLPLIFFRKIKKAIPREIDAVLVYSPPLPLGLAGGMVKRKYRAKFILNIQDIFPQNALDLGILKWSRHWPAILIFELIEKIVYKQADKITFHSDGGRMFLIEKKHVPQEKIATLYNWVDMEPYKNLNRDISFRKKFGLEGKFIFLFGGIMGPAQGLEVLIKAAQEVADLKDVVFLLVGDGMEKEKLQNLIREHSLTNVMIKSFVSKEDYPYLVKDADVGVICLSSKNKTPFIPGKFLGYMAAGLPIVAFLNKESDGFNFIIETHCGYAVRSDNLAAVVKIIRLVYDGRNNLKELGENGFNYASKNLTPEAVIKKLENLF